MSLHVGIDLDNTIIDYDQAFGAAAAARGISISAVGGKTALRDALRALPDGEAQWTRLQADVYGPQIGSARLFPGVRSFFTWADAHAVRVTIVSHKSAFAAADPDGPNLRECAASFLAKHGVAAPVYFESTRAEKCARIASLAVSHFIDDLIEVFEDPEFPQGVARWLFAPHSASSAGVDRVFGSWEQILVALAA